MQGQRMADCTSLPIRSNDHDPTKRLQTISKGDDAGRMDTVVVSDQNQHVSQSGCGLVIFQQRSRIGSKAFLQSDDILLDLVKKILVEGAGEFQGQLIIRAGLIWLLGGVLGLRSRLYRFAPHQLAGSGDRISLVV